MECLAHYMDGLQINLSSCCNCVSACYSRSSLSEILWWLCQPQPEPRTPTEFSGGSIGTWRHWSYIHTHGGQVTIYDLWLVLSAHYFGATLDHMHELFKRKQAIYSSLALFQWIIKHISLFSIKYPLYISFFLIYMRGVFVHISYVKKCPITAVHYSFPCQRNHCCRQSEYWDSYKNTHPLTFCHLFSPSHLANEYCFVLSLVLE